MARHSDDRNKLIQILAETPLVNYACKKVGIGRTTFYRWMKDNPDFKREVDRALESGRGQWVEIAESALMKNVKDGNLGAIKFFLSHNDPRYIPKRSIYVEPLDARALERYEWYKRAQIMNRERMQQVLLAMKNLGIIKRENTPLDNASA